MTQYCHRDQLKAALSLPTTATGAHALLDAAILGVSQEIDMECGCGFAPSSGTRYYQAAEVDCLTLDYPLLAVDSVTMDVDGDSTYESTMDSGSYYLTPDNATSESPKQPFWAIETRDNSTVGFPPGVRRGVKVTGTWGWFDERESVAAKPATGISAVATTWDMVNASEVHPGQLMLVDSERVLVVSNALSGSATAAASGQITVRRAQAGSVGATHSSASVISVYSFPVIERACLFQSEMDYRAQEAPLGGVGGNMTSPQQLWAPAGLHPFIQRLLHGFRVPVAR